MTPLTDHIKHTHTHTHATNQNSWWARRTTSPRSFARASPTTSGCGRQTHVHTQKCMHACMHACDHEPNTVRPHYPPSHPPNQSTHITFHKLTLTPHSNPLHHKTTQSDVWSLGVLLYQCCTLRLPFEANNPYLLMTKIIKVRSRFSSIVKGRIAVYRKGCLYSPAPL